MRTVSTATTPLSALRDTADAQRGEWLAETATDVRSTFADVTGESIPAEVIRELRRPLAERDERYRPAPDDAYRLGASDRRATGFPDAILDDLEANHVLIAIDTAAAARTEPLGALTPGARPLRERTPPIRFRVLGRYDERWVVTPDRDDRWYFLEPSGDALAVHGPGRGSRLELTGVQRAPVDEPLERRRCPCCRETMAFRPATLRQQYHCPECGLLLDADWTWYHVAGGLAGAPSFPRFSRRPAPLADPRPELRDALRSLPDPTPAD